MPPWRGAARKVVKSTAGGEVGVVETLPSIFVALPLGTPAPTARDLGEEAKAVKLKGMPEDPGDASRRLSLMANGTAAQLGEFLRKTEPDPEKRGILRDRIKEQMMNVFQVFKAIMDGIFVANKTPAELMLPLTSTALLALYFRWTWKRPGRITGRVTATIPKPNRLKLEYQQSGVVVEPPAAYPRYSLFPGMKAAAPSLHWKPDPWYPWDVPEYLKPSEDLAKAALRALSKSWDLESGMTFLGLITLGAEAESTLLTLVQIVSHASVRLLTREPDGDTLFQLYSMAGDDGSVLLPVGRTDSQDDWDRISAKLRALFGLANLGSKEASDSDDAREHVAKVESAAVDGIFHYSRESGVARWVTKDTVRTWSCVLGVIQGRMMRFPDYLHKWYAERQEPDPAGETDVLTGMISVWDRKGPWPQSPVGVGLPECMTASFWQTHETLQFLQDELIALGELMERVGLEQGKCFTNDDLRTFYEKNTRKFPKACMGKDGAEFTGAQHYAAFRNALHFSNGIPVGWCQWLLDRKWANAHLETSAHGLYSALVGRIAAPYSMEKVIVKAAQEAIRMVRLMITIGHCTDPNATDEDALRDLATHWDESRDGVLHGAESARLLSRLRCNTMGTVVIALRASILDSIQKLIAGKCANVGCCNTARPMFKDGASAERWMDETVREWEKTVHVDPSMPGGFCSNACMRLHENPTEGENGCAIAYGSYTFVTTKALHEHNTDPRRVLKWGL